MAGASVPYTPYQTEQASGNLGGGLSVRSTPQDAGVQVGAAVEKSGDTSFEIAQKQQGLANETMMTQADADFATKLGKIKGDYTSLTGMAAYTAFPAYQESVKSAFEESRAQLPPAAKHGFDMLAARSMANHVADGSSYAASQLKEANRAGYSDVTNVNLQALLDPQVAASKERSEYHIDTLKYATEAQLDDDHPGLKKDPESGVVSFDESTPEGQSAKSQFQQKLDMNLSQGYVNRFDTLAKHDIFGSYGQYQDEREKMPRSAQVALDASFAPRLLNAHKSIATDNTLAEAQREHYDILTKPGNPVSVIMKNELHADGQVRVHSDGDGSAIGGINSEAFPKQFEEAKNILDTQGQTAAKEYIKNFYQKDIIEKNGIDKLPSDVQDVVADGVSNHWSGFQNQLIDAAKAGVPRDELIQMRREEYQRLADTDPEKYGKYLTDWNNRLDNLQQSTEGKKAYATNENGGIFTTADYYRTHSNEVLAKGDAYAESQMPGDLALKRLVRQSLTNEMSKTIANESAQHALDNKNIMRAISEHHPETEEDLRNLPGMGDLLDRVATQDPKFTESIPTILAKVARRNDVSNSTNGYDTVMRVLLPHDYEHPNSIASVDHLVKQLGRSEGPSINMKDYNDAKQALELDPTLKENLSKHMAAITNANGNVDGKGKERALQWYNNIMGAWNKNAAKGDKALSPTDFSALIKDDAGMAPNPPSRMQQLDNLAKEKAKQNAAPILTDKSQFDALNSGDEYIRNGIRYRKP